MDKRVLQTYAVWAKENLEQQIEVSLKTLGINGDNDFQNATQSGDYTYIDGDSNSYPASLYGRRRDIISQVRLKGYKNVIEEFAYTWFNRLVALRFMELHNYLSHGFRVLSSTSGSIEPDILKNLGLVKNDLRLDMNTCDQLKGQSKTEELFRYVLICQCNALSDILPKLFLKDSEYMELLLPKSLLIGETVLTRLVRIPEENFSSDVQIIGWLYQYYNTKAKERVFANLKKNVKTSKEDIPAATQLFTPDWIVRYMVENSLGRLWLEGHPNEELKAGWKYYLEEAEQEPEAAAQLEVLRAERRGLAPKDIRIIDPCCGSGHILVYAFDVLMQIYESQGYSKRDAAQNIVRYNLYGLDIDERATQLAYFAVMMKARQYDRQFFTCGIQPQVYYPGGDQELREFGSLVLVDDPGEMPEDELTLSNWREYDDRLNAWSYRYLLAQKYDVVVTNPPYMGASNMNGTLAKFVKKNYPDSKSDLSTAFMEQTIRLCNNHGYMAMINIPVWMFLSSYEKLREKMIERNTFINMVHPGRGIFGSDFGTTTFVIAKQHIKNYIGAYRRLFDKQGEVESIEEREQAFLSGKGMFTAQQDNFSKIPGMPVAYWIGENMLSVLSTNDTIGKHHDIGSGLSTADNERFLRFQWEVSSSKIAEMKGALGKKWFHFQKGGEFRRWYGNLEYVVNWENDGEEIKYWVTHNPKDPNTASWSRRIFNVPLYFQHGITWAVIGIGKISFRETNTNAMISNAAGGIFSFETEDDFYNLLGGLNTKIWGEIFQIISPTVNYSAGIIQKAPFPHAQCSDVVRDCIQISKSDWDSFETSLDFKRHPLVPPTSPGKTQLVFALKIGEKKWIEKLQTGEVWFGAVDGYIRKAEDEGNDEQGDRYEGVFARCKADAPIIHEMQQRFGDDLEVIEDGDYRFLRRKSSRFMHLFCMYAIKNNDLMPIGEPYTDTDGQTKVKFRYEVSPKMYRGFLQGPGSELLPDISGYYCSVGHLHEAIEKALEGQGIFWRKSTVVYDIDLNKDFFIEPSPDYPELNHKRKDLSYQNECRYIIKNATHEKGTLIRIDPLRESSGAMALGELYMEGTALCDASKDILLSDLYAHWEAECNARFAQLKANEEELNRIFIDIYGLQDEVTPEVEDKDVTVRRANRERDVKSLISYLIGVVMGRYSRDEPGLAYAGGEWDASKYRTYQPDDDGIVPIYRGIGMEDGLTAKLIGLLKLIYGEDSYRQNIDYIADSIGHNHNESSEEALNRYLNDGFFADHLKVYQKRPIYWLFSSGKNSGFKCLIYMHRYTSDTLARINSRYFLPESTRLKNDLEELAVRLSKAEGRDRVRLEKERQKVAASYNEAIEYGQILDHMANRYIEIDLDDGVKANYAKFQGVEMVTDSGSKVKKDLLAPIK